MFVSLAGVLSCFKCGRTLANPSNQKIIFQGFEVSSRQLYTCIPSQYQNLAQLHKSSAFCHPLNLQKPHLQNRLPPISSHHSPSRVISSTTTLQNVQGEEASNGKKEKDNIITVPNLLCVSRIVAAPVLANLIIQGEFTAASALFVAAGATDLLDGWIARNFKGQSSSLGSFLDPLADKILVCTLYLSLTFANLIPPSLCSLIVSRDLFLVYAGLYIRYMSVQPPFSLKKYFDVSLPTATVQPTTISKINTGLQFLLIAVTLGGPVLGYTGHRGLHYLWAVTGTTTFLSAVSYAFMKDTYKFSNREYDHQFGKKLTAFILFILFNIAFTLKFPTQKISGPSEDDKECPLTGVKGTDCPIIENQDEKDFYSERSNQYYLKKIRENK
eukprot:TRINITY_DN1416_c1_g1_i5.p1 TRINITY_DN1416_c1_g1~~TRINITY_DN1416_c1_g1_i5.p1  ORF type:complete len:400 (+),score=58.56 TRINITY_DN1416_c1_g1_i5:47-1201(+)